jgi:hypothetical protein
VHLVEQGLVSAKQLATKHFSSSPAGGKVR